MALRNGLLVHGPTHWSAAVRRSDGTIAVASGRKPRLKGVEKLAGVRGVVRLGEAMIVIPLVKRALPEAKLPFQDAKVLGAMFGAAAGGRLLRGHLKAGAGAEVVLAAVSLAPSLVALRGGELAEYHGVEHKAIAAYENDDADAADAAKEHDRCGSHLMAPLLASNLAGGMLLRRAIDRPGPAAQFALGVASLGDRRRGLRLVRAPRRQRRHADAAQARLRAAAPARHARAERAAARGRARRARRDPARRANTRPAGLKARSTALPIAGGTMEQSFTETIKDFGTEWSGVFMILFMFIIAFFLWRTLKMMPRTKPVQIKPEVKSSIGWEDIAGVDEAKDELREVVEFLRDPKRFRALGARVPAGVLLHGPPGTGKTLLAKAVAHESGAQFFSQSAASFVEMFAGLGASRIRRLFREARKHAPAIIFIDELDAVGGRRGSDNSSEREQTLNQLLVEMDGFNSTGDVVVMAASNLLEKLDPALLRPGRFDRQVFVSPPDIEGRERILGVHTRGKPLGPDVDLGMIAARTSGLTGADLANLCNEAAIRCARRAGNQLTSDDFEQAFERVVAGVESRRVLNAHEKRVVAFHEAGHALCAELLPGVDTVHKISIIPRGRALGYTLNLPDEDRYLKTREELIDHMTVLLGGRVAEQIVFGAVTTGASDDLKRVSEVARAMVYDYAMGTAGAAQRAIPSDVIDSEQFRRIRDEEQQELAYEASRAATELLTAHREKLEEFALALLEHEVLERDDIARIMRGVPRMERRPGHGLRVVAAVVPRGERRPEHRAHVGAAARPAGRRLTRCAVRRGRTPGVWRMGVAPRG